MICQSFDTTRHYREEHNMVIEKRDRTLLVMLFYQNGSKSRSASREFRQMKGLRRGPMSTNGLKKKMVKFENTGDFSVAPGIGRWSIPMEVVDKVAVAVADRVECTPNSASSAQVVSHELGVPWSTVKKILRCILHRYPTRFRLSSNWNPMIHSNILILPFSFWHECKCMTYGQRIFCGLTRHTLHWKVQWICRTVKYRVQLNRL